MVDVDDEWLLPDLMVEGIKRPIKIESVIHAMASLWS